MTTRSLVEDYRPERFEDVIGQESVVLCLSGLIKRGQRGRDILLHGAVGSGKTSLAWIYARALNCQSPGQDGSPCEKCSTCSSKEPHGFGMFSYDVARNGGNRDEVLDWTLPKYRSSKTTRYKILFFDEAQALTPGGCDALLNLIERPDGLDTGVLFFFATTEVERLRDALRSRLFDLLVRPLAPDQADVLLRRVADARGITYDDEALRLLAALKGGYPRNLLHGLERAYEEGDRLTVAQVRAAFDVDQTEPLLAYVRALAAGDLATQTRVLADWQERWPDKIRWSQAFLLSLYYNDIRGRRLSVDGLIDAIAPRARQSILKAFCHRLNLADPTELEPVFARLLDFWPMPVPEAEETALMLRVTLFHRLVNEGLAQEHEAVAQATHAAPAFSETSGPAMGGFGPPPALLHRATDALEPSIELVHLTRADVRQIVNCASFLVQEHNVFFNAALTVRPNSPDAGHEAATVAIIQAFHNDLARQVGQWGGAHFASLALLARDEDGVYGRFVAHLSRPTRRRPGPDCLQRAQAWCRSWEENGDGLTKIHLRVCDAKRATAEDARAFHWTETLGLCTGLPPEVMDWNPIAGEHQSLLELLKLKSDKTAHAVRTRPRVIPSQALSQDSIEEACPRGLKPLSAYDDRAWAWIQDGWEQREFEDRSDAKAIRAREIDGIVAACGPDEAVIRAAIEEWHGELSADPHRRPRRWRTWWE